MTREQIENHFKKSGALLEGHFILRSGLHSRQFFQCALALQDMPAVEQLGKSLAALSTESFQTVVSPAMGGLVIGQEIARQLKKRFIFAEKSPDKLVIRRGFKLKPDERCLIVEDVVTQGGRVRETMDLVRQLGAKPVEILVLVDRSENLDLGLPMRSLLRMHVETFNPNDLPEDLKNTPAIKPGS